MELSEELLQAAENLGAALRALPAVQEYLEADAAVKKDPEIQQLKAESDRIYRELISSQRSGSSFDPSRINEFYRLRERLANHHLVLEREACLQAVKPLFEKTASSISSILSMDYTDLVK